MSLWSNHFAVHACMRVYLYVCMLFIQLCLTLCDSMDYSPSSSLVHGNSPGKNTEVGSHFLFQGIILKQGSHPGLPHCRQILYHLSHQGSLIYIYVHIYSFIGYYKILNIVPHAIQWDLVIYLFYKCINSLYLLIPNF